MLAATLLINSYDNMYVYRNKKKTHVRSPSQHPSYLLKQIYVQKIPSSTLVRLVRVSDFCFGIGHLNASISVPINLVWITTGHKWVPRNQIPAIQKSSSLPVEPDHRGEGFWFHDFVGSWRKAKDNTSCIGNMVEFLIFCSENSSALGDIRQRFAQSSSKNYLLESTVCTDVKGKDTALLINTVTSCATKQSRGFNQYRYVLCNQTKQGIKSIPLRLVRPNKAGDQWSLHQSPCNPFSIPFTVPVCEPNSGTSVWTKQYLDRCVFAFLLW